MAATKITVNHNGSLRIEGDFEIVDPDTLDPVERISQKTLVAVAAYAGSTRLIDNTVLNPN